MATILIVDDRQTNRQFLLKLLGYFGHRLLEAGDGVEAFKMAREEHPDLIISDLVMPNMDGQELAMELRNRPEVAGTPVIFYSATYTLCEARAMARNTGAFGVLSKPSAPQKILDLVNRALEHAKVRCLEALVPEELPDLQTPFPIDNLAIDSTDLEAVSYRLASLIEMSLELTAERRPERLLQGVAHMARKLVTSKYAFVALLTPGESTVRYFWSHGQEAAGESAQWPADAFTLSREIEARKQHAGSFLSVPLESPSCRHGWLCLGGKFGDVDFIGPAQGITAVLACQAASAYEKVVEQRQADECIKELNLTLESRLAALQLANRSLEDFSYSVTHDLEAPLRVIAGFAEILADEHSAQLDEKGLKLLAGMTSTAKKMKQLIRDLLDFSRVTNSSMKKSEMDMGAMARSVSDELASREPARQVEMAVQALPRAFGDPAMLRQVFVNLIANARKFTRDAVPARIEVGSSSRNDQPVYFVKDNGAGFDMTDAARLFGVFQRLHSDADFEGTGIGLSLVSQIVKKHGGEVWAEAAVGKGAAFYFTL